MLAVLLAALLTVPSAVAGPATPPDDPRRELLVSIDWQAHPAMHIPWSIFRKGLLDRSPKLSFRHQFRQTVYAPYLEQSGVRLFLAAAMAAERARNPEHARTLILDQLAYVEDFVAANPERYAIGRDPAQVRDLLATTDKIVIVHSIEGAHFLLEDSSDAAFWAEQGVALMTLIHLRDDEFGGAGILPTGMGPIINRRGNKRRRKAERRGLTERGKQAIVELDAAGILVDMSHMTQAALDDALEVTGAHDIAPVVTHGKLASIRNSELAQRDDQVIEIYRQGGVFSLGLSGSKLDPIDPQRELPADVCRGTLEMFRFHHEAVQALLLANTDTILGTRGPLDSAQYTRLAVGWSSDWNGWLSHSKPVYGASRCRRRRDLDDPLDIDTRGLAHPGMLPQHWERLAREGMDLEPMLRSAERFLQLWTDARAAGQGE